MEAMEEKRDWELESNLINQRTIPGGRMSNIIAETLMTFMALLIDLGLVLCIAILFLEGADRLKGLFR